MLIGIWKSSSGKKCRWYLRRPATPPLWTAILKKAGIRVVHVVSSTRFALKAAQAGCDAVVAEGFEAGGHNGRDETTTFVLLPAVCAALSIPVIAAGGIANGRQMYAAMVLGAEGVQIGSRFVLSAEASGHPQFKQAVINAGEGDTILALKSLMPVRLLKNRFAAEAVAAEEKGADTDTLKILLGRGRAKRGMFEGDMEQGELEIGQASALLNDILPAGTIVENIWDDFRKTCDQPLPFK